MKTLEEAIIAALTIGPADEPPNLDEAARIGRMQGEYMQEVYENSLVEGAAATWIQTTARLLNGIEAPIESVLKSAFKNGISLGIVIGIQMERNELPQEKPS